MGKFWKDARNLCQDMFEDSNFTDVTLVCEEGKKFKAHKIILSSCSALLKDILVNNPHPSPILYFHNIKEEQMEILVRFIYTGEASVDQQDLDSLLDIAEKLKIKGLAGPEAINENRKSEENPGDFINIPKVDEMKYENDTNENTDNNTGTEPTIEAEQERTNIEFSVQIIDQQIIKNTTENGVKIEESSVEKENEITKSYDYHDEVDKYVQRIPCKICDHTSTNISNLNRHLRSRHGFEKKKIKRVNGKYPCDLCDYKATQSGNLTTHRQMKHEDVRFHCNFCDHDSGSISNLKSHIKRLHRGKE